MGREHVIPQFVLRMKEHFDRQPDGVVDFAIQGTGNETRSFIYIDDFIHGMSSVMKQGEQLGIYHIGTEQEVSICELAHLVARTCGREIRLVPGDLRSGSTLRRCPDIRKLKTLGFEPLVSLGEGVRRTTEWYLEHAQTP
jgi:nucleoside-diphosphate-sugar epimerase